MTGFIVRKKNLWYYKCRKTGCKTVKSAKQLHEQFKEVISSFQINENEAELIKIGVAEMFQAVFDEVNENQAQYKAKISELKKKVESAEENLVTGIIDRAMFDKFTEKFKQEIKEIENELEKTGRGSSNLEKCLETVIKFCSKPLLWWENASVGEKMIFQNLLFPSGIIYDRKNDRVQTPRVNSFFAPIPVLTGEMRGKKNGESIISDAFPVRVTPMVESSNFLLEELESINQL